MAADGGRAPTPADHRRIAQDPGRLDLVGAPEGFDALVMADIVKVRGRLSVFVARDGSRLSAFVDAFNFFAPQVEVIQFPSWDCLPYDRIGPSPGVAAQRMTTLGRLAHGMDAKKPVLLATTVPAMLQRVPPKATVEGAAYSARTGNVVEIADLERYFAINGYQRASTVSERGEFAIRGGVIDVFPPGSEEPVRLDLFGDTLESIRAFDPETQRSTKQLKEISLLPVSEVLLDKDGITRFRRGYVEAFGAPGGDPLYETVSEGGRRAGMEHWLPLFYPDMATLLDYLPSDALIATDHLANESRDERLSMIADAYDARAQADRKVHYHPLEPDQLYMTGEEWRERLAKHATRRFSAFQEAEGDTVVDMGARQGRTFIAERQRDSVNLFEATADHAKALATKGKRVLFASWSDGSSDRLGAMLADHGLKNISLAPYWDAARAADPKVPQRVVLPLETGFETETLAVISETDILGDRLARPRRRRRAANFLAEASALTQGDLVVHIDHGIGRYEGLKTLDVQGAPHDCLELHYGGASKLYLPVENIDLLTRYGADGEGVQL
uniref:CarD family transcriptional regulator n=1 Tax=Phenylobacterium sp. TaxID=1871053 RepID=UPI00286BDB7A